MPAKTIASNQNPISKNPQQSLAASSTRKKERTTNEVSTHHSAATMSVEKREIKLLYCPSTDKLVPYVASDNDRIDIGGIAKAFGLEPTTLKINGHFIGGGPDLIASSVTWRGLISFFAGRRLPIGAQAQQPIVVHGRMLRPGSKRAYEPTDDEPIGKHSVGDGTCGRTRKAGVGESKKCKLANSGPVSHGYGDIDTANKVCRKRKHFLLDNLSLMKKLKINEIESSRLHAGQNSEVCDPFSKPIKSHFPCSYSNQKMKRTQDEETVVAMTPKRIK